MEQPNIGDAQASVNHDPDKIFHVVTGPYPLPHAAAPYNIRHTVACVDDALQLVVAERRFVGDTVRADGRLQIARDGANRFGVRSVNRYPFTLRTGAEETP